MKNFFLLFIHAVIMYGCNQNDNPNRRDYTAYYPTNNLDETIKNRIEYLINSDYPIFDVNNLNIRQNGDEVIRTFEIVDSLKVPNGFTLVFTRYTIGTKSYKDVYRYEKVGGVWGENYDSHFYYSDYDKKDPFGYDNEEEIKALIKRINDWRE